MRWRTTWLSRWRSSWPSRFVERHVLTPVREEFASGASDHRVALAASLGLIGAVWPQIGTNWLMAMLLAWICGMNRGLSLGVSYVLEPLQFVFMLPNLRLGETLLGVEHFQTSVPEIIRIVYTDPIGSFEVLGIPLLHAILGWLLIGPVVGAAGYPLFRLAAARIRRGLQRRKETQSDHEAD